MGEVRAVPVEDLLPSGVVRVETVSLGAPGFGVQIDVLDAPEGYGAILSPSQALEVAEALTDAANYALNSEGETPLG